jgi:V8-like Glu-specific endopeptidase
VLVMLVAFAIVAIAPATQGAARLALRLAAAMSSTPEQATLAPPIRAAARSFGGTAAVGALFSTTGGGGLASHFCTASVVHSPHRDIVITAAHCVTHHTGLIEFVPGYTDGHAPYGIWTVTSIIVDQAWASAANPDDDVAFLVVSQPGTGLRIEDVTGAEQLRIGPPSSLPVQVIGYPDGEGLPVTCQGRTTMPLPHQMEFDCRKYTDGTSGGPFLLGVDPVTGDGSVIGVIGGYQQGGNLPQISYSAVFGKNVAALYQMAIRQG